MLSGCPAKITPLSCTTVSIPTYLTRPSERKAYLPAIGAGGFGIVAGLDELFIACGLPASFWSLQNVPVVLISGRLTVKSACTSLTVPQGSVMSTTTFSFVPATDPFTQSKVTLDVNGKA